MNRELLEKVAKGEMTVEEAEAAQAQADIKFKISPKGAVSVYGLQQFPVTLYKNQWRTIFANGERLEAFIVENDRVLNVK